MPRPPKPRALLRLQEVLDFCFPPGVEHPKAAARLFLLCEYGPLIDGWLWGGPLRHLAHQRRCQSGLRATPARVSPR